MIGIGVGRGKKRGICMSGDKITDHRSFLV